MLYRRKTTWNIFRWSRFSLFLKIHYDTSEKKALLAATQKLCLCHQQLQQENYFDDDDDEKRKFTKHLFHLLICIYEDTDISDCVFANDHIETMIVDHINILKKSMILIFGISISRRNSRVKVLKCFLEHCFFGRYEKGWIKAHTTNYDLIKRMYLQSICSKAYQISDVLEDPNTCWNEIFKNGNFPSHLCGWIIQEYRKYPFHMVKTVVTRHKFCAALCNRLLTELNFYRFLRGEVRVLTDKDEDDDENARFLHCYIDTDACKYGT